MRQPLVLLALGNTTNRQERQPPCRSSLFQAQQSAAPIRLRQTLRYLCELCVRQTLDPLLNIGHGGANIWRAAALLPLFLSPLTATLTEFRRNC
jgi:hypothetical protein